jgi:hypothetical protein
MAKAAATLQPASSRRRLVVSLCALGVAAVLVATAASATATWTPVGSMAAGREYFAAVVLQSGKVFVASGGTAELFDPASGTFSAAGDLTVDRGSGLTATVLQNGEVLLVGGESTTIGETAASAELYDPSNGTFTATGSMSVPRAFHTATLLPDGRVLVAGGHSGNFPNSALASAELYDPVTGTFTPTGSMSFARQNQTATLLPNGTVLVAGGYAPDQSVRASAEIYNPASGTFTQTGSMADGRGDHTATLLNDGKVLIAGGHTGFPGGSLTTAELYDPANGTFARTGDMTEARGAQTATLLPDGTVLIAGGYTAFPFLGTTLASTEIYDPNTGSFTPTASMNSARGRDIAVLLPNGKVLVAGGLNQCCSDDASAEEYSPTAIDETPPVINVPAAITADATSQAGAVVTYSVTATDPDDAVASVVCSPTSGSTFPIGTTTVTCKATDTHGNSSNATFTVHVNGAADQLADLAEAVAGVGPGTSLADKITQATAYLDANDVPDTCSILTAFTHQVKAQTGKTIPQSEAATLTADALQSQTLLGC